MKVLMAVLAVGFGLLAIPDASAQQPHARTGEQLESDGKKWTRLRDVPEPLQGAIVTDEAPLIDYFQTLLGPAGDGPDIRFEGRQLRQGHGQPNTYEFRQYIFGGRTRHTIIVEVSSETLAVTSIGGRYLNDIERHRNDQITHEYNTKRKAMRAVLKYISKGGQRTFAVFDYSTPDVVKHGDHQVVYEYRGENADNLWLGVGIEVDHPRRDEGEEWVHEWYLIDPSGNIMPWVDTVTMPVDIVVCDGRNNNVPFCSAGNQPIVINQLGECQAGYICTGANNKYRTPERAVKAVDAMWNDIRGTTN